MGEELTNDASGEWRLGHFLPQHLTGEERVDVEVAIVVSYAHPVPDGLRLRLVIKFWYGKEALDYFDIPEEQKPTVFPFRIRRIYGECWRWVPFSLPGQFDELNLNWSVKADEAGRIYERLELISSHSLIEYNKYFPFIAKTLAIKFALDGTGRCEDVNLIPKLKKKGGRYCTEDGGKYTPDIEITAFSKETSPETLDEDNLFVSMMVRTQDATGVTGQFTRIYYVALFYDTWCGNMIKYLGVNSLLLAVVPFAAGDADVIDSLSVITTLALAMTALLFILPKTTRFSPTELCIVLQILTLLLMALLIADDRFDTDGGDHRTQSRILATVCFGVVGICAVIQAVGYYKFTRLSSNIREACRFGGKFHLCEFGAVEKYV